MSISPGHRYVDLEREEPIHTTLLAQEYKPVGHLVSAGVGVFRSAPYLNFFSGFEYDPTAFCAILTVELS